MVRFKCTKIQIVKLNCVMLYVCMKKLLISKFKKKPIILEILSP